MKKAITFAAAALAMAAVLNPVTATAAGTNPVTVVYKGNAAEFQELVKSGKLPEECLKWGTVIWNENCPQWKPEQPEMKPEQPEMKPEQPEMKPEQPETKPEQKPEMPETGEKSFAQQVVELVNVERQKEGLAPLTVDGKIADAADIRAKEIQTSFSHTRPNGTGFSTALKEAGAAYRSAGENIAWGQKTPEEVVKGWMNSPGHRANIMNKNYSRIGVSHLKNAAGTSYWVQLFAD